MFRGIGTQGGRTSFQRSSHRRRFWRKATGSKTLSWLQDSCSASLRSPCQRMPCHRCPGRRRSAICPSLNRTRYGISACLLSMSWDIKAGGRLDVVPTIYVVTSDSTPTLALITGKGRTLKKYTLKEDLSLRKSDMVLEIGHDMLWGKDLQQLCKANISISKI